MALGVMVAMIMLGCSSTPPIYRPPTTPHSNVTLSVDWRLELVDNGLFIYEPSQLGRISVSPDGRLAYVGTTDGRMVAVNINLGEVVWELELGSPIDGGVAFFGDNIYFGASNGRVYSVDANSARIDWEFEAGGDLDSTPAVTENDVVMANGAGAIICLSRDSGAPRWTATDDDRMLRLTRGLQPPVKGQSSPVIIDGFVYAGFPSGLVVAIALDSGEIEWQVDLAGQATRHTDVDEPPVLLDGTLFASSFAGGLYALDRENDEPQWHFDGRGTTRPLAYGTSLLTTTIDGRFVSLNREDGAVEFTLELSDRAPSRMSLLGDYVIVPTTQGPLYVLDAGSPHIHARFQPTDGFASATVAPNGHILAFDNRGVLHSLTLRTDG